jgi:hypothetical protein
VWRSVTGLLIAGGGIDVVMVGTISIGSDAETTESETLFDDEAAEESMGIDFGRDPGERWSVGKGLRGKDSVVAMMERAAVANEETSLLKYRPARSWHTKPGDRGESMNGLLTQKRYEADGYVVISMNVTGWGFWGLMEARKKVLWHSGVSEKLGFCDAPSI